MILYHFYWIKYLLHLIINHGLSVGDLKAQEFLFFYLEVKDAIDGKRIIPDEGIFHRSLIGMSNNTGIPIAAGTDWAKNTPRKLFETRWEFVIIDQLEKFSQNPTFRTFSAMIPEIFQQDFIQGLDTSLGISIEKELWKEFSCFVNLPKKAIKTSDLVLALSKTLASLVQRYPEWFRKRNLTGQIILPNLHYIEKNMLPHSDGGTAQLKQLANLDYSVTRDEAIAFLHLHEKGKRQQRFLESFILMNLIGRQARYQDVEHSIRSISKKVVDEMDFSTLSAKFSFLDESLFSREKIEEMIFFWKFNFFLSDGEWIARLVLNENKVYFYLDDVKNYLKENHQVLWSRFLLSFDELSGSGSMDHLNEALTIVTEEKQERASTLDSLGIIVKGLKEHRAPLDLICEVMEYFGIILRRNDYTWDVQKKIPDGNNMPFFYGIDAFLQWVNTLQSAIENG